MIKKKIAIYPGTFDPITFGHIDIIKRALEICDKLVVAIAKDNSKNPLFSLDEKFERLLVNFAEKKGDKIIIRGLRAVSDFEYEFQMFGMNSKLNPNIQTVFLPASEKHHFIASKFVKEVMKLGGDVSNFVSKNVLQKLKQKL